MLKCCENHSKHIREVQKGFLIFPNRLAETTGFCDPVCREMGGI